MDAIDQLAAIGVPIGPPRPGLGTFRMVDARRAIRGVDVRRLRHDPPLYDALAAYLSAFKHHWPTAFRRLVNRLPRSRRRALPLIPLDANRYLKLRRIAIENLAAVL